MKAGVESFLKGFVPDTIINQHAQLSREGHSMTMVGVLAQRFVEEGSIGLRQIDKDMDLEGVQREARDFDLYRKRDPQDVSAVLLGVSLDAVEQCLIKGYRGTVFDFTNYLTEVKKAFGGTLIGFRLDTVSKSDIVQFFAKKGVRGGVDDTNGHIFEEVTQEKWRKMIEVAKADKTLTGFLGEQSYILPEIMQSFLGQCKDGDPEFEKTMNEMVDRFKNNANILLGIK